LKVDGESGKVWTPFLGAELAFADQAVKEEKAGEVGDGGDPPNASGVAVFLSVVQELADEREVGG
jgi:hypothetical protein